MYKKKLLNEKISKIISNMLESKNYNINNIKKKLIEFFRNEGLDEREIVDILYEISNSYYKILDNNIKFRILSPLETKNLTEEALDYLIDMKEENRISEEIFEGALLDISKICGTIDLPVIKELLKLKGLNKKRIIN